MRKALNILTSAAFFLLCYAQIPMLTGYYILGDCRPLLIVQALLLPITFLLSLLPGKVGGGKRRKDVMLTRSSRGADPDPDRGLRNEALPEPERKAFPLRACVCLLISLGVLAAMLFVPFEGVEIDLLRRILMSVIMAAMLPLALRVVAVRNERSGSVTAGYILYILAGAIAHLMKDQTLQGWLTVCGLLFLILVAFTMNDDSMDKGTNARASVRPPAGVRRKNRLMLALIAVIGAVILYFDRIRLATAAAAQWVVYRILDIIAFIMNLGASKETVSGVSGGGGGEMDLASVFGAGETSTFWKAMEKVLYVLTIVVIAVGLFFFARTVFRRLRVLFRYLLEKMRKFTEAVGEEYKDEQESLFDWGETQKELGEGLKKRLQSLFKREKKWDQMDVRERVRYIVRSLYRRSEDAGSLRSLTVHEALGAIKTGHAQPEELAGLYDQARYGLNEPDAEAAERIRKEAKV